MTRQEPKLKNGHERPTATCLIFLDDPRSKVSKFGAFSYALLFFVAGCWDSRRGTTSVSPWDEGKKASIQEEFVFLNHCMKPSEKSKYGRNFSSEQ